MRKRVPFAAFIAAILMVSQAAIAGELFPKVIVTVSPLKAYVDEILHGVSVSGSLLRPGQDPHSFALAPTQARMLDEADIVIVPDMEMSPFLKRLLASKPKLHIIELSRLEGADPLPYALENPWVAAVKKAGKEDDDEAPAPTEKTKKTTEAKKPPINDPHLWLDPERMAALAEPLANAMADQAPETRPALLANARALSIHLRRDVIPAMREMLHVKDRNPDLTAKPEIAFITYHAAYQYFLARFGIEHHGEITLRPDDYIGAKSLDSLLMHAKAVHIRCVIGEQNSLLVERIAAASGAKVILVSPEQNVERKDVDMRDWIANDYDRLLYKTAKSFGECL